MGYNDDGYVRSAETFLQFSILPRLQREAGAGGAGGEPNVISASQMDPAWPIWPKIGTTK
jgi:hypothetical protein